MQLTLRCVILQKFILELTIYNDLSGEMSSKLTISMLQPRNFGNNGIIVLLFVFNVHFILKPFYKKCGIVLKAISYRHTLQWQFDFTYRLPWLIGALRLHFPSSFSMDYVKLFLWSRKIWKKLTGNSGELITLSSQIDLRKLQSIAVRSAVRDWNAFNAKTVIRTSSLEAAAQWKVLLTRILFSFRFTFSRIWWCIVRYVKYYSVYVFDGFTILSEKSRL